MAPQVAQWVTFDDDEKLKKEIDPFEFSSAAAKDFEFRTYDGGRGLPDDMCVADEVFFKGRILPLRPGSRSDDSIDRCSSSAHTLTTASRSNSSGSGSRSSRSFSGALEPPRRSVSNNFYAHPSPTPQAWRRHASGGSGGRRRSTGSPPPPGWGLLRLGVAKAPEIDLSDLRCRRLNSGDIGLRKSTEKATAESGGSGGGGGGGTNKAMMRFLGRGFGCRCSSVSATPAAAATVTRKGSVGHSRRRMIEWLDEL